MDLTIVNVAVPSASPCLPIVDRLPISDGLTVAGPVQGRDLGWQYLGGRTAVLGDVRTGTDKPVPGTELVRERGHVVAPVTAAPMSGFDATPVVGSRQRTPM